MLSNRQFKDEFDLIGLARLVPENSIVFPNKKLLSQKEKTGKVIPVLFWSILAVAIFIGFGIWITQLYSNRSRQLPAIVSQPVVPKKTPPGIENNIIPEKQTAKDIVQSPVTSPEKKVHSVMGKVKNPLDERIDHSSKLLESSAITKQAVDSSVAISVPQKIADKISIEVPAIKNLDDEQIVTVDNTLQAGKLSQNKMTGNSVNAEPATVAQTVSYTPEASDNNQNYVFYDFPTDEFRKTKMGGFIKKVKRIIERNNPINRIFSGNDGP